MKYNEYEFSAVIWRYKGKAAWHFVTLPSDVANDINIQFSNLKKGWGSLPVDVRIGSSSWKTSIFPDSKLKSYVLPIKGEMRVAEHMRENDSVDIKLEIRT